MIYTSNLPKSTRGRAAFKWPTNSAPSQDSKDQNGCLWSEEDGRRPVVVLAWREFSEISVVFNAKNMFQNTQLVQAWAPVFIPPTTGGRSMSLRGKSSSLNQNLRFFTLWRFLWGQLEAFFRRGLDFGMTLSIVHSRCGFGKTGCWGYEWAVTSVPVSAE